MLMKRVERLLEKMTERNDHQHHPQSQQGGADPQANQDQRARNQLDEGDGESDDPQGPRREKGVSSTFIDVEIPDRLPPAPGPCPRRARAHRDRNPRPPSRRPSTQEWLQPRPIGKRLTSLPLF